MTLCFRSLVSPVFLEGATIIEPRPNTWVNDVVLINSAPTPPPQSPAKASAWHGPWSHACVLTHLEGNAVVFRDNYPFLYRSSKLLKAPKLPISTWLTPQTTLSPVSFHLDSDLPPRWNGDRGFVKTGSVHGLCLVISTSTGLTEAKKG